MKVKDNLKKWGLLFLVLILALISTISIYKCHNYKTELENHDEYELLDCPFCGGEPYIVESYGDFTIHCKKCEAWGGDNHKIKQSKEQAVKLWNKRK